MGKGDEGRRFWVGDYPVACGFCRHGLFHDRAILLNTVGMTLMDIDWANRSSVGLVCARCGYLMEFLNSEIRVADPEPR